MKNHFPLINEIRSKYSILKWDMIFNLIVLAGFLWARELKILAFSIFIFIYIVSYLIFEYKGLSVAIIFMALSVVPFWWDKNLSYQDPLISKILIFSGWAILSYGIFWIIIALKNYKYYIESLKPEVCQYCEKENKTFYNHLGRRLCENCFYEEAFKIVQYHDTSMYKWDHDLLMFFEEQIGGAIPEYNIGEDYEEFEGELDYSNIFGYKIENKNLVHLSLPNCDLKRIPDSIGLLIHLRILNLRGNELVDLPLSIQKLVFLKILDLRDNILKYITKELENALHQLGKRKINILI